MNSPPDSTANSPLNCYTIPAEKAFVNVLARWIMQTYGQEAAALTKVLVLLPNRRACRSLREAFLDCTGGKPILLPKIQPLGDIDEDAFLHYQEGGEPAPPVISPMRRQLLLAKLVSHFKKKQSPGYFDMEQAAELARQLARFMDDMAREGLTFDRLDRLVPEELAAHWQQTLEFLTIVSRHWPALLEEEGALDPVAYRNRQLLAIAQAWHDNPPHTPVIAAGSTGSMPATARLLAAITRLPQGRVILPGLDTAMPDREWETVRETHPQYGLKHLLETIGCKRGDVRLLEQEDEPDTHAGAARITCLRAFFQSPEATSGWSNAALPLAEGMKGVSLLTAETLLDEARMIAIALREALESPGKTAALVTPDRTLARMVASQMQRFGVAVDDSAGRALADTPAGCFLSLVAEAAFSQAAPVPVLSLLRHPLAAAGRDTAECRRLSRLLELRMLRGLRRAPGFDTLAKAADIPELKRFLPELEGGMRPLMQCMGRREIALGELLKAHMACAEWLATTTQAKGGDRLWAGEDGNALASLMAECLQHADVLDAIDPASYAGLFQILLSGHSYYPRFGLHPRLHILSPIEARLQHFDTIILGSLNEGIWPPPSEIDPWMSRPMRGQFGLPATERSVGQSAHDVYLLCAAPEVLLSRARKVDGQPTVPSRWLVRMETLIKGIDAKACAALRKEDYYERAKRLLEAAEPVKPIVRPAYKPPLAARPRKMKVTSVDVWLRDPYAIYAQYVLRLRKLDALDEEPDAADFGNVIHHALERFAKAYPAALPDNAVEELLRCGEAAFSGIMDRPAVACLWWPRFEVMAGWLIEQERARRGSLSRVMAELKGQWEFETDGKPFTLTTKIDRMEINRDGSVRIGDYKTGYVPPASDVAEGNANQLPLEALIAMHGTLEPPVQVPAVAGLEYWRLAGRPEKCEIISAGVDGIEAARARLEQLIRMFDNVQQPYAAPRDAPERADRYNDFQHLTRRAEWGEV